MIAHIQQQSLRKEQSTTSQDQLKRQTAKKSQPFLFHLRIQNDSILSEVYLENVERRMYYVMTAGATHEQTTFFSNSLEDFVEQLRLSGFQQYATFARWHFYYGFHFVRANSSKKTNDKESETTVAPKCFHRKTLVALLLNIVSSWQCLN